MPVPSSQAIRTTAARHGRRLLPALALSLALSLAASPVRAAPEEIQVYMDEMNAPGEFGLDVHLNWVASGQALPDYPGAQPPLHVFRATPEFSYGLTPSWELGAYFLTSADASDRATVDGQKLRIKYLADKTPGSDFFYGANLEVGRVNQRLDENPWNGELKGIWGYRGTRWTVAVNANIDFKISGPAPSPSTLELDSKFAYKTGQGYQIGLESYNELGELGHLGRLGQRNQTLFAVLDTSVRGWDLNLGLGRGLSTVSDRWLIKAVVGVPF